MALDTALRKLHAEEDNLPWCSWYLDDGTLVGSLDHITSYLERLLPALQDVGLEMNLK